MLKPRLKSLRKIAALNLCAALVGKDFDVDHEITEKLGLAHSVATKILRDLRGDGYLSYIAMVDMDGHSVIWHIYGAERFDMVEVQPLLPF